VARSVEARKVLRELRKELSAASERQGRTLVWSAEESMILDQIASLLDRKAELLAMYEEATEVNAKVKLSAEARLLGQAAAKLVRTIQTDVPDTGTESQTTRRARHAVNSRWNRATS
jgi:hypothetical protein